MDSPLVLVVDDDQAMRTSVAFLLSSVGLESLCFASAQELLDCAVLRPPLRPGCILLDIRMPGMSGIELLRHLGARECPLPVIIVTGHGDVPLAVAAMKVGAADFIEKPYKDQALLDAVNAAVESSRSVLARNVGIELIQTRLALLSRREREVLNLVLEGKQNKEIAAILSISVKTVEGHRQMTMEKMRAKSVVDLARMILGTVPLEI